MTGAIEGISRGGVSKEEVPLPNLDQENLRENLLVLFTHLSLYNSAGLRRITEILEAQQTKAKDSEDVFVMGGEFVNSLQSELEIASHVHSAIFNGPEFVGELAYKEIPHPRKEGRMRHVCLLQVPSGPGGAISSEELSNLEYRAELDLESVNRRLDKEWCATSGSYRWNSMLMDAIGTILTRATHPFQGETGKYMMQDNFIGDDASSPLRWTEVHFAPLGEDIEGGYAFAQGKRSAMEDAQCMENFTIACGGSDVPVTLSGLFDGHSGLLCAKLLALCFPCYLKKRLELHNATGLTTVGIWNALKFAFVDFTRSFHTKSGSCANVVVEIEGHGMTCANLGDSRAFLITEEGGVIPLSEDQSFLSDEDEEEDLGKYERGNLHRGLKIVNNRVQGVGVNMARAIGDKKGEIYESQVLSARPKIVMPKRARIEMYIHRQLKEDEKLLLVQGCDGLFEVGASEQYANFIASMLKKGLSLPHMSAACVEAAFVTGSKDNISVMIKSIPISQIP